MHDNKDEIALGIKHPEEKTLKKILDDYNSFYLYLNLNLNSKEDIYLDDNQIISNSINDPEFENYLKHDFPSFALNWISDNVIQDKINWDEFQKIIGFSNYL